MKEWQVFLAKSSLALAVWIVWLVLFVSFRDPGPPPKIHMWTDFSVTEISSMCEGSINSSTGQSEYTCVGR